ncbi:MAG: hypothetical protein M9948_09305 [Lentimicrobium sp.]|nr:hypothetical protein [Lentimicrobium sp.]
MKTQDIEIGNRTVIDVVLVPEALDIEGVVVTALGISREKKSLGYATQQVTGDDLNKVKAVISSTTFPVKQLVFR